MEVIPEVVENEALSRTFTSLKEIFSNRDAFDPQYLGEVDIVEDIYIYNSTLTRCGDVGKVKVWPGAVPGGGTASGGGSGRVRNVTWASMHSVDNDGKSLNI